MNFLQNDAVSPDAVGRDADRKPLHDTTGAGLCTHADFIKTKIRFICSLMQKSENS
jgi:hypothetical protein